VVNGHVRPGPVSRPSIRLRITKVRTPNDSDSHSSSSNSNSSNSSASSSSSSSSHNSDSVSDRKQTRVKPQRAAVSRKRRRPVSGDSEDSYRPAQARRRVPIGRRRKQRVGRRTVVRYQEDSDSDRRCTRNSDRSGRRRHNAAPNESEEDRRIQYDTRPSRVTNKVQYCEASEDSDPSVRRSTRGRRTHYAEDSNASSDETPMLISVSSRGRIRKMTPRARAALLRT
jgi:hypothetical protein